MAYYALSVESTFPLNQAINVYKDIAINVVFNRDVKIESLTGNIIVRKKVSDTVFTNVNGTITCANKIATFTPDTALDATSVYIITVIGDDSSADGTITGVKDIFGNGMLGNFSFSFTTTDVQALVKPIIISPSSNSTIYEVPTIEWNAVLNVTMYEIEVSPSSDFSVDFWSTTISNGDTSIIPNIVLIEGLYHCRLRYSIDDEYSLWSDTTKFYYDASGAPVNNFIDFGYMEVLSTTPNNPAYNVPLNTEIQITFSDNIDSTKVDNNITLIELPDTVIEAFVDVEDATLTISAILEENKQYKIKISNNMASTSDKTMGYDYEYNFTTAYSPLYANYMDVYNDIYMLSDNISPHYIYKAIVDAGNEVMAIYESIMASNYSYSMDFSWDDQTSIPYTVKQYVRYKAGYIAYTYSYMQRVSSMDGFKQLDNLTINQSYELNADVRDILAMLEKRIKPWLDMILGVGIRRGYAKGVSVTKGESTYPYQDYHNRSF